LPGFAGRVRSQIVEKIIAAVKEPQY